MVLHARLSIKYAFTRVIYVIQNRAVFPCSPSNVCWTECSYDSMRYLYSCDPSMHSSIAGPGDLFSSSIRVASSWLIGPNSSRKFLKCKTCSAVANSKCNLLHLLKCFPLRKPKSDPMPTHLHPPESQVHPNCQLDIQLSQNRTS